MVFVEHCGYTNGNQHAKKLWLLHFYYNKIMVIFIREMIEENVIYIYIHALDRCF